MSDETTMEQRVQAAEAKVAVLENAIKEYQQIVHNEKMNVQTLQEEVKGLEAFKKQKADVEALKVKNEKLKKNLLAVEAKEKARADAEVERRMSEVDADVERRVAEKVAEATAAATEAARMAYETTQAAEARLAEIEAKEAAIESRVQDGTSSARKTAEEEKKAAQSRAEEAEKTAAKVIIDKDRFERAMHALLGVFNYIDKGKSLRPSDVLATVKQIAGDALEADKKLVEEAKEAKKAAALLKTEQERLALEEAARAAGSDIGKSMTALAALEAKIREEEILRDPYTVYARKIFGLGADFPVTPEQRYEAKTALFAVMYGGTSCQHVLSADGLTCEKCGINDPEHGFDPETHLAALEGEQPPVIPEVEQAQSQVLAEQVAVEEKQILDEVAPSEPTGEVPAV